MPHRWQAGIRHGRRGPSYASRSSDRAGQEPSRRAGHIVHVRSLGRPSRSHVVLGCRERGWGSHHGQLLCPMAGREERVCPYGSFDRRGDAGGFVIALTSVTLEGHGIRLEPLAPGHQDGLAAAAADGRLWELWFTFVPEPGQTGVYIADALDGQRAGQMLPWAVRETTTGAIAGSTRFH